MFGFSTHPLPKGIGYSPLRYWPNNVACPNIGARQSSAPGPTLRELFSSPVEGLHPYPKCRHPQRKSGQWGECFGQWQLPHLNFGLSKNLFLVGIFVQNAKFRAENPHLWKTTGKIEILSTHNLFSRKFAVTVGKLQLPAHAPPTV